MTKQPLRVKLTEFDFYQLCCGRTVKRDGAELALDDIGLGKMFYLIQAITNGSATPYCDEECTLRRHHMGACLLP